MTDRHAEQPRLCAECLKIVRQLIAANPTDPHVLKGCRHQPGGVVVSIAHVREGRVVSWSTAGPCSEQEAEALAVRHLQTMMAAGAKIHAAPVLQ